jgi:hypothetical protein
VLIFALDQADDMNNRQKIALVSALLIGLLLLIELLRVAFTWTSTLIESMRNDIRVTGLVVALFSLIIAVVPSLSLGIISAEAILPSLS